MVWLENGTIDGRWHFSFDQYFDRDFSHFGTLRVFNDDTLSPGATWPLHSHRNIEVVTYCASGVFRHADQFLPRKTDLEPSLQQQPSSGRSAPTYCCRWCQTRTRERCRSPRTPGSIPLSWKRTRPLDSNWASGAARIIGGQEATPGKKARKPRLPSAPAESRRPR